MSDRIIPIVVRVTFTGSILFFFLTAYSFGQDTRHVAEPSIPDVCESLTAQLSKENGRFIEKQDATLDTARIQQAIDHCGAGKAVELKTDVAHDVFLSAPIDLKPSVVLLIRAGVTLYGTRDPR